MQVLWMVHGCTGEGAGQLRCDQYSDFTCVSCLDLQHDEVRQSQRDEGSRFEGDLRYSEAVEMEGREWKT